MLTGNSKENILLNTKGNKDIFVTLWLSIVVFIMPFSWRCPLK